MNKILFNAQSIDLYSEDFEYMQDSLENELYKIFRQVTNTTDSAAIVKGFELQVSSSDPTKLMLIHSGNYGSVMTKAGILVESDGTIDGIELATTSTGAWNYVYVKIESIQGSYNRASKVFVPNEKKAIDLADYSYQYDRIEDTWEIIVYDQIEFEALTSEELEYHVFLGKIQAEGDDQPLTTNPDLTGRNLVRTYIQDGSILSSMISPTGFMLPQDQVSSSETIDDEYVGVPATTEDDINKVRTEIKSMKGTLNWDDSSPTTLFDFDRSINAVHENGVFLNSGNDLNVIPTSTGFTVEVQDGLANVGGAISRVLVTSTGEHVTLTTPTTYTVGEKSTYSGQLRQFSPSPSSYTFYIYNDDVSPTPEGIYLGQGSSRYINKNNVLITNSLNGPVNAGSEPGFIEGPANDYTIDADTGLVTVVSVRMRDCWDARTPALGGTSETDDGIFECFYDWGNARYDAITMGINNELSIFDGTPAVDPQIPVTSTGVVNLAYVFVKPFDSVIASEDIHDCRYYIDKVREIIDIPVNQISDIPRSVERINYYTSTGEIDENISSTGYTHWELTTTSTGDYVAKTEVVGCSLETTVYAKAGDEIWLIADKTPWINQCTVSYTDANSDTYSHTVDMDLFFNTFLHKYPIYVVDSLDEGYIKIKIEITDINEDFRLYNLLVGKLDLYYNIHGLSDIDYIVPQKITNYRNAYSPIYSAAHTQGYQDWGFSAAKTLSTSTGIADDSTSAEHIGTVDVASGVDWSGGGSTSFEIEVDNLGGGGPDRVEVILNQDCASSVAVAAHINAQMVVAGISSSEARAEVTIDNYIKIYSLSTGTSSEIDLDVSGGTVGSDLGWVTGVYNGTDGTTYACDILIDGYNNQSVSITGKDNPATFSDLITLMNNDVTGATVSFVDDGNGFIRVTSDSFGAVSTIAISDTDLFSSLDDINGSPETAIQGSDDIRKGNILLNISSKVICGSDGRFLNYWDIEQSYPVSRVGSYFTSTGGFDTANLLAGVFESINDCKIYFTPSEDIIGSENHQRVMVKFDNAGTEYDTINVVIHDDEHNSYGIVATLPAADIIVGWNYFEIPIELQKGTDYHYHVYYSGTATSIPSVVCLSPGLDDKKIFYAQYYTPSSGLYKDANVINIVDKSGNSIVSVRSDGENIEGGRYDLNQLDIMAVDFSDDLKWDSWAYDWGEDTAGGGDEGLYIGIDVMTGRVKFPEGYDARNYYVEFNTKELGTRTDAKSLLRHSSTESVEDSLLKIRQGTNAHLNGIINGNFDIWQRVRKGSTDWLFENVNDGEYTADMMRTWLGDSATPGVSVSRETGTDTSTYCLRIGRTSNFDSWGFEYRMPFIDSNKYINEYTTVSVELRKGSSLTSDLNIEVFKSSVADDFSSLTRIAHEVISNENLDETDFRRFSTRVNIIDHADMKNLVFRISSGSMTGASNVYFEAQKFQYNIGKEPYHFQPKLFNDELEDCMAYYEKSYDYNTAPGVSTEVGANFYQTRIAIGSTTAGTLYPGFVAFLDRKKGTPSITLYSKAGTINAITNETGTNERTGCTVTVPSERGFAKIDVDDTSSNAISTDNILSFHYETKYEL